jgi:hypothetical protein
MYSTEREIYYKKLLSIYRIPNDLIYGWLKGKPIAIETDTRMVYDEYGIAVMQFRH